jgi:hypothetical protein
MPERGSFFGGRLAFQAQNTPGRPFAILRVVGIWASNNLGDWLGGAMFRLSGILISLFSFFTIISCSNTHESNLRSKGTPRFPKASPAPVQPATGGNPATVQSGKTRELVRTVTLGRDLKESLERESYLYTSDNCVQWVRYKQGTQTLGDFLELSSEACSPIVLGRLDAVVAFLPIQANASPASYTVTSESGVELGLLRVEGELSMTEDDVWLLDDLCTYYYKDNCFVEVENSKFKKVIVY